MRFLRQAKVFRGPAEATPFAGVFFLLILFVLLGSLVYTPGVKLNLPLAEDLPGTDQPLVSVAVDAGGQYYYDNQLISAAQLKSRLAAVARQSPEPLALLVQADKTVNYETLVHLSVIARDAGIKEAFLATLPQNVTPPAVFSRP